MLNRNQPGVELRFPEASAQVTMVELLEALEAVNDLFELVALATLPRYGSEIVPTRLAPRRYSRLQPEDRLRVARLGYGSELGVWLTSAVELVPPAAAWAGGITGAVLTLPKVLDAVDRVRFFRDESRKKRLDYELHRVQVQVDTEKATAELFGLRHGGVEEVPAEWGGRTWSSGRPAVRVSDGEEAIQLLGALADDAVKRVEDRVGPVSAREVTGGPDTDGVDAG